MPVNFDPILVEVLKNEIASVTEEMAIAVCRTGRSAMVKIGDFAASVCDGNGRLIGPGYAAPFQLAAFMDLMSHLLAKWPKDHLRYGDVIMSNDPYAGMGHLPDVVFVMPVFWKDKLVAFNLAYSHHTDIGGRFPGGFSSQCTEIFEEGLRISLVKFYEGGKRNDALLDTILANVRTPNDWQGDAEAKIAGCWRGAQEIQRILERYGLDAFQKCCDHLVDYAESETRKAVRTLPSGRYVREDVFEDDGFGNRVAYPLKLALEIRDDEITADFTGTAPQAAGAVNLPLNQTKAMVYAALKSIVGVDVLLNSGFARPIKVVAPPGTLVNPTFPAAVGGRAPLAFRIVDMAFRALAKAIPSRVPVPGEGGDVFHFIGEDDEGRSFTAGDIFFGGWGARPTKDGIDGIAPVTFGSYGSTPAEILEREYPIVVEGFGYIPDTEGAGRYRGALSVYKQWRFLKPGRVMIRTNRLYRPSEGLGGGGSGGLSTNILNPGRDNRVLPFQTHLHLEVSEDDCLYHVISGSGGHGNPLERDPQLVLADVNDGKISSNAARARYGVIIDFDTIEAEMTNGRVIGRCGLTEARTAK